MLRTSKQHPEGPAYYEKECLTVYEAIQLYTEGSAAIIHKEHSRGRIAPGYDADFTVLSGDPFRTDPKKLHELEAVKTVVVGRIVYEKEDRQ